MAIPAVASASDGSMLVMSAPSQSTCPDRTGTNPYTALNTVDLPAPLGPITQTISPARTSRSTPRMTSCPGT